MSSFRIRPRFKQVFDTSQKDIEQLLCDALENEKAVVFSHLEGHIYIKVHPSERHFWSPQLHLSFEEEDGKVTVRGLYGPNPTLWSVFFFGYVGIGILAMFLGMWGFSLWSLGKNASILWSVPALGLVGLLLYLASQAGQKLGAQQMFDIHHIYEKTVNNRVEIH